MTDTENQHDPERARQIYRLLMEEVKIRALNIDNALYGRLVMPGWMIREFCYLQLRMICEVIALGCLVAHGDIAATQSGKLPKEYAADRIIYILGQLHPDFYPVPIRHAATIQHPDGKSIQQYELVKDGFLTKQELKTLNQRAGNFLHRGAVRNLLSPEPIDVGFPDVVSWHNKITHLLSMHTLNLFDQSRLVCIMKTAEDGSVYVTRTTPPVEE